MTMSSELILVAVRFVPRRRRGRHDVVVDGPATLEAQ
jgi:hypothetical protein